MATIEIPSLYKAAVYDQPGEISTKIVELQMPVPAADEVLVRLTHSGVCASDLTIMTNGFNLPVTVPNTQVGGHEGVGTIVQLGPGSEAYGLSIGSRVGIKWLRDVCGTCVFCLNGRDSLCPKQSASGRGHPGTFQQYVTAPARYLTPIPDGLDSAAAAPLLCAGLTTYAAIRKTNIEPGCWLAVAGAGGGLGHLFVQLAVKAFGARVIGIDHSSKEEVVRASGAELFFDAMAPTQETVTAVTGATKGLGVHAVVVCAGSHAAYAQAVDLLRPGGILVGVGMPAGPPVPIASADPGLIVRKELKIVGSILGNRQDAIAVLDLAARGIIKVHYELKSLDELTQVFQDMKAGSLVGRIVLNLQA